MMKNFCFAPVFLSGIAVALAHGGNDKAPYFVLVAALFSLGLALFYVARSFSSSRRLNMRRAFRLLYVNKEKTQRLSVSTGVQSPLGVLAGRNSATGSNIIVLRKLGTVN